MPTPDTLQPHPQPLPVGTRIRFTRTLDCGPTGDHPALLYAKRGELGSITGHGCAEGYWVRTDSWPNSFGASPDEFEVAPDPERKEQP